MATYYEKRVQLNKEMLEFEAKMNLEEEKMAEEGKSGGFFDKSYVDKLTVAQNNFQFAKEKYDNYVNFITINEINIDDTMPVG